ncbi:a-pheromone processing metallopeptidase Ste23 [Saitoella complicata NRRL Y-17804]|nr:a-pheromone processing metallopeptidase Ste23 [Saitoella complicata NRRL Y-17804]ODQ53020.1 a-pheromone processing metallopeptidase Ste23 [Saitoella complicata NRRL Y-17804]
MAGTKIITEAIEKPLLDNRSYRYIRLPNQLEALLVHDPQTDKASAALDVNVGHLSDPKDLPGLAHFCEHLLFMGTEKYPDENEYAKYLSMHSGFSNAFTGLDDTNYYFECGVGEGVFEGALDRFAQFFRKPLFLEDQKDRELKAVDSENKKNLQVDIWRLFQLEKSLSNPEHPYNSFGTGNLVTLSEEPAKKGLDVRQELLKWYGENYSANLMKLVVFGREELGELQKLVEEKFSDVVDKNLPRPGFRGYPLTEKELKKVCFIKPVKDIRRLDMTFTFPDTQPNYASQPERYLSHLIGHEGPGSILSYLKKKSWANGLSAGSTHVTEGADMFKINIELTEEGLEKYEEVVEAVFRYIAIMKSREPEEWVWKEMANMAEVGFKYAEKSPASKFTMSVAGYMQKGYKPEEVLSGGELFRRYDPKAIKECLDALRPDNFRIFLISQKEPNAGFTEQERWYGTEYRLEPISSNLQSAIADVKAEEGELRFPGVNEFIPTNFETHRKDVPAEAQAKRPTLIKHTSLIRFWHKKDDTFWVPKANANFLFRTPLAYATPKHSVLTRLYCDLVKDALNEYSYDADLAGLEYNLYPDHEGINLQLSGYNDKLHILLEKILSHLAAPQITADRFAVTKERLMRAYKNFEQEPAVNHAVYWMGYLMSETMWNNEEKLAVVDAVTLDQVQDFAKDLLKEAHVEALVHGNMFKEDALKLAQSVEEVLKPAALARSQLIRNRSCQLPENANFAFPRPVPNPENLNSAIEYMVEAGNLMDVRGRSLLMLLSQIANEPCFDQLRTKEQLGYSVWSGARKTTTAMGFRVIIQSERNTDYLESRIESFLVQLRGIIADMKDEEYQTHVKSIIDKKTEKLKNLGQETSRYWQHILSGYYDFHQLDADVENLKTISKDDLLRYYDEYVMPGSATRRKLSVHMQSQKAVPDSLPAPADHSKFIQGLSMFLNANQLEVSTEDLQSLLVGLENGAMTELPGKLRTYLIDVKKADPLKVDAALAQGMTILQAQMPQAAAEEKEVKAGDEVKVEYMQVLDTTAFKAGLLLSPAPRPVAAFETFYEAPEAKL